ncbi:MAG: radical SAM protein, partial [Lentisphaeria bacterium]
VEFCPIIQATGEFLNENGSNLEHILQQNPYLGNLRSYCAQKSRNCVLMESPKELAQFISENGASDSSGRDFVGELAGRDPIVCHHIAGKEIPEKSLLYKFGKKSYFFGFGAYG